MHPPSSLLPIGRGDGHHLRRHACLQQIERRAAGVQLRRQQQDHQARPRLRVCECSQKRPHPGDQTPLRELAGRIEVIAGWPRYGQDSAAAATAHDRRGKTPSRSAASTTDSMPPALGQAPASSYPEGAGAREPVGRISHAPFIIGIRATPALHTLLRSIHSARSDGPPGPSTPRLPRGRAAAAHAKQWARRRPVTLTRRLPGSSWVSPDRAYGRSACARRLRYMRAGSIGAAHCHTREVPVPVYR